jgi:hypothetical protein
MLARRRGPPRCSIRIAHFLDPSKKGDVPATGESTALRDDSGQRVDCPRPVSTESRTRLRPESGVLLHITPAGASPGRSTSPAGMETVPRPVSPRRVIVLSLSTGTRVPQPRLIRRVRRSVAPRLDSLRRRHGGRRGRPPGTTDNIRLFLSSIANTYVILYRIVTPVVAPREPNRRWPTRRWMGALGAGGPEASSEAHPIPARGGSPPPGDQSGPHALIPGALGRVLSSPTVWPVGPPARLARLARRSVSHVASRAGGSFPKD